MDMEHPQRMWSISERETLRIYYNIYIYIHVYIYIHYTYIYIFMYIYVYIYVYIYIHYTYIYIQPFLRLPGSKWGREFWGLFQRIVDPSRRG